RRHHRTHHRRRGIDCTNTDRPNIDRPNINRVRTGRFCAAPSMTTKSLRCCLDEIDHAAEAYPPMELDTAENTLFAFPPIKRIVPTTITRITASITAYSAMSCPSSSDHSLRSRLVTFLPSNPFGIYCA